MPTSISLLIAHPKELIRAGLRAMLTKSSVTIVGEATHAANTLSLAKKHKPDVLLIDTAIPEGDCFDVLSTIKKSVPATKFILLSALDNPTYMARACAIGASNFLLKSVSQKELVAAIEQAAAGKSPSGAGPFTKVAAAMDSRTKAPLIDTPLTPRETQVLSHVAYGLSNHEIAQSLTISVETVKEHVQNLLRKLAVSDRTQAAVWAVQSGLV